MYTIKVTRWFWQLSLLLPVIFPCGPRVSPHQRLRPFAIKRLDAHALTHAKHTELSVHCHRNLPHEPITVTYPETLRSFLQSRNYIYMPCTTGTEGSLSYSHEPSTCPILHQILHILTTTSLKSILIFPPPPIYAMSFQTICSIKAVFLNFVRPRPGNFFFIRRGPGPNKFTRKYLSNFF